MSEVLPVDDFPGNLKWEPLKLQAHLLDQLHQGTKGYVFLGTGSSCVRVLKQRRHRGFHPQTGSLTKLFQFNFFFKHVVSVFDFFFYCVHFFLLLR